MKYGVITQAHDKPSEKTVYTQEEGDEEVESPVGEYCCHQLASDQSLRICNEVTGRKKSNMKGLVI